MFYLQNGLAEVAERTGGVIFKPLGKFLAVAFAILCIGGSFGGGNTFQVNQSLNAVQESIHWLGDHRWVFGLIMTILTGLVIIGGIKRIAQTAEKIVPTMWVFTCLLVSWCYSNTPVRSRVRLGPSSKVRSIRVRRGAVLSVC